MERILAGRTNAGGHSDIVLPLAEYRRFFNTLPEAARHALTARWGAPESDPGFCTCYADRFTDAMIAAPHATDYFEVPTSTAAANACRRQLAGTP